MHRTAFLSSGIVVMCVLAACAEHAPTGPPTSAAGLIATTASYREVTTIDPVTAALTALDDVEERILPTLGTVEEIADLAAAVEHLTGTLARGGGSLAARIRKATDAVLVLENVVEDDAGRRADLKAVLLAIEAAEDLR